jgi:hypothetical protein
VRFFATVNKSVQKSSQNETSLRHAILLSILLLLCPQILHAQDSRWLQINIGDDISIQLPALPESSVQRDAFLSLTPREQNSFYAKRWFLMQKMVGGLTKPGIGSGIRWAKGKVSALKGHLRRSLGPASSVAESAVSQKSEIEMDPSSQEVADQSEVVWLNRPDHLSEEAKAFVQQTVSAYVDNFWTNSTEIARANGIGVSMVVGAIWNTTLAKLGVIHGRSLSIDLGMDFSKQEGYLRLAWDKQTKKTGGISLDVGLMADVLLHVTDPSLQPGDKIEATHTKLPLIGCFRSGTNYKAWGAQLGFSVFEMIAIASHYLGLTSAGEMAGAITTIRAVGAVTAYQTNLERDVIQTWKIPATSKIFKVLGLSGAGKLAADLNKTEFNNLSNVRSCESALIY